MELKEAKAHVAKNIKQLEIQVYNFESVAIPRYEADKKVLSNLRQTFMRIDALLQKEERGEEVTVEEFRQAVPEALR